MTRAGPAEINHPSRNVLPDQRPTFLLASRHNQDHRIEGRRSKGPGVVRIAGRSDSRTEGLMDWGRSKGVCQGESITWNFGRAFVHHQDQSLARVGYSPGGPQGSGREENEDESHHPEVPGTSIEVWSFATLASDGKWELAFFSRNKPTKLLQTLGRVPKSDKSNPRLGLRD